MDVVVNVRIEIEVVFFVFLYQCRPCEHRRGFAEVWVDDPLVDLLSPLFGSNDRGVVPDRLVCGFDLGELFSGPLPITDDLVSGVHRKPCDVTGSAIMRVHDHEARPVFGDREVIEDMSIP